MGEAGSRSACRRNCERAPAQAGRKLRTVRTVRRGADSYRAARPSRFVARFGDCPSRPEGGPRLFRAIAERRAALPDRVETPEQAADRAEVRRSLSGAGVTQRPRPSGWRDMKAME